MGLCIPSPAHSHEIILIPILIPVGTVDADVVILFSSKDISGSTVVLKLKRCA